MEKHQHLLADQTDTAGGICSTSRDKTHFRNIPEKVSVLRPDDENPHQRTKKGS